KSPPPVVKTTYIGMAGYYAGPRVLMIDKLGLGDPLLARLPTWKNDIIYNGHFPRPIPEGYPHAAKTGSVQYMDPSLGKYYLKLRLITSGKLDDPKRIEAIIRFNL